MGGPESPNNVVAEFIDVGLDRFVENGYQKDYVHKLEWHDIVFIDWTAINCVMIALIVEKIQTEDRDKEAIPEYDPTIRDNPDANKQVYFAVRDRLEGFGLRFEQVVSARTMSI